MDTECTKSKGGHLCIANTKRSTQSNINVQRLGMNANHIINAFWTVFHCNYLSRFLALSLSQ